MYFYIHKLFLLYFHYRITLLGSTYLSFWNTYFFNAYYRDCYGDILKKFCEVAQTLTEQLHTHERDDGEYKGHLVFGCWVLNAACCMVGRFVISGLVISKVFPWLQVINTMPMNEKTASLFHHFEPLYLVIDDMPRPPVSLLDLSEGQ